MGRFAVIVTEIYRGVPQSLMKEFHHHHVLEGLGMFPVP
jgi:hypothetical protein